MHNPPSLSPETESAAQARRSAWLVVLCCAVYGVSYLTRKSYDASILAICQSTGMARTAAGLASTAAVTFYGSGQFVTGILADRFDPRRLLFWALLVTAACNAAMPFAVGHLAAMVPLWAANGFAQAMFWPPLVKIVADNLSPARYRNAVFWVSVSSNLAILAVFLLVSGCIRYAGWRASFAIVTALALAMAALWRASVGRLAPDVVRAATRSGRTDAAAHDAPGASAGREPLLRLLSASGMFFVMGAIACHGVMRDGIEVWAPSIVSDLYGLSASGSILSVVVLPVFAVASMAVARRLRRILGDEILAALVLFGVGLAGAATLFATNGGTLALGLPVLAVLSASMHGANMLLIAELPGRFAASGRVGTLSGILNAFTYVGAALSIYGFAALHERFAGWRPVFGLWIGVLSLSIVLLLLTLHRWRSYSRRIPR